jgi:hypothetical protein
LSRIICSIRVLNALSCNKRTAFLLMLEFFDRAGLTWTPPAGGQSWVGERANLR